MKTALLGTLSILLSSLAPAANFDLRVSIEGPDLVRPGTQFEWTGIIENGGPDAAENITYSFGSIGAPPCAQNEKLDRLEAGGKHAVRCFARALPDKTTPVFLAGDASAPGSEPPIENNRAFKRVYVVDTPDLQVGIAPVPPYTTTDLPFEMRLDIRNLGVATATNVRVVIASDEVQAFGNLPTFCRDEGTRAVCTLDEMPPTPYREFAVYPSAKPRTTMRFTATITAEQSDPDPANNASTYDVATYDTRFVTSTNDDGPGSLREAIAQSNVDCVDDWVCEIAFRIDPRDAKWVTIRPASPLPAVVARNIRIDGSAQTRFFGDTNPDGPEVEINGARAGEGDRLSLRVTCATLVIGLAINGFDGNGVYAAGTDQRCERWPAAAIAGSYISSDPAGMEAVPNRRGVFVERLRSSGLGIDRSIIGGNHGSGVFVWAGASVAIGRSKVGINRTLTGPLSNGASGVFVHPRGDASIGDSHVSFNRHFGASVAPGGRLFVTASSFQANHQLAIDHGLDGPSDAVGALATPVVASARYDSATGTTTVEGTFKRARQSHFEEWSVNVYANDAPDPDGHGEGQYFLGRVVVREGERFTLRHKGDLRGKWIAATTTQVTFLVFTAFTFPIEPRWSLGTSEFSRAVEATE